MKLRILLPAFLLIFGIALGAASHANADYVLWTPTTTNDQNVFSFTPQGCTMSGTLYINADGATQGIGNTGNAALLNLAPGNTQPYTATDFTIAEPATPGMSIPARLLAARRCSTSARLINSGCTTTIGRPVGVGIQSFSPLLPISASPMDGP